MPSTFGLLIYDERMARIAREVLTAHAMIVCLGLLYGILQAISGHLIAQEMHELRAKTGDRENVGTDASMDMVMITSFVMSFLFMTSGFNYVSDITCENFGWTHPSKPKKVNTRSTLEDCEAAKETARRVFAIYGFICLIAALLALCMLCNCCTAAYLANKSFRALEARSVFCRPPLLPLPDMLSGQNGVVMVIGQPIGTGAIPMGQTVMGGPVMGSAVLVGLVMGTSVPGDAVEGPSQAKLQV